MSDRISGFTVTFKNSVSEEYMELVKSALQIISGVQSVDPWIEDSDTFMGMMQEQSRITRSLLDLIKSDFGRKKDE